MTMAITLVSTDQFLAPWLQVFGKLADGLGIQAKPNLEKNNSAYARYAKMVIDTALTENIGEKDEVLYAVDVLLDDLTVSYGDIASKLRRGFGATYIHDDFWKSPTGVVIFRALRRVLGDELMVVDVAAERFGLSPDRIYYLIRKNLLPTYLDTIGFRSASMFVRFDQIEALTSAEESA